MRPARGGIGGGDRDRIAADRRPQIRRARPSATSSPAFRMAIRSARSASSSRCVVSTTVTPAAIADLAQVVPQIAPRAGIEARCSVRRAAAERGPMDHALGQFHAPPQAAGERFGPFAGSIAPGRADRASRPAGARARRPTGRRGVPGDGRFRRRSVSCPGWGPETRRRSARGWPARWRPRSNPRISTWPCWSGISVESRRNSVVLPPPLGPRKAKISPGRSSGSGRRSLAAGRSGGQDRRSEWRRRSSWRLRSSPSDAVSAASMVAIAQPASTRRQRLKGTSLGPPVPRSFNRGFSGVRPCSGFVLQVLCACRAASGLVAGWPRAARAPTSTSASRKPDVGNEHQVRKIDMKPAGIVSTYFQLASYLTCMKNRITSIALVQQTAIMNVQPTCGWSVKRPVRRNR